MLSQMDCANSYNAHFDGKKGSSRTKNSLFVDIFYVIQANYLGPTP